MSDWTPEKEAAAQSWLDRQAAKDPHFEDRTEFGKLLMKHIGDLTPEERRRYAELQTKFQEKP